MEDMFEDVDEFETVRRSGSKLYFYSDVSVEHALQFQMVLNEMEQDHLRSAAERGIQTPDPIWIYIHSYGGDAFAGLSMMDAIRECKVPVHTVVDGFCASAATLPLLGSDKRYMRQHASVLIHQIRTEFGGKFEDLLDETTNSTQLMQTLKKIYTRDTKLTRSKIDVLIRKETYLNAEECASLGLVHHIL